MIVGRDLTSSGVISLGPLWYLAITPVESVLAPDPLESVLDPLGQRYVSVYQSPGSHAGATQEFI